MKGWLDNYNDSDASAPQGFEGEGYSNKGRNYSPAWGGQFQMGGSLPGATGNMYARVGAPSNGPYAKKTMASAQNGKKFKLKDERGLVMKPAESTSVKRKDFDLQQSKENKDYYSAVVAQKKEAARRAKLTQSQREREDYNAYNEEHGSIKKYVPESNWERTKAIVSNPMTVAGYAARHENLPGNFQAGPRNEHDYAVDWINPLQGAVALSNIPGQLGRGEFMDAGLSGLDALDLGAYAKGARTIAKPLIKKGVQQLGNIKTSVAPELKQSLHSAGFSLNDLNPFKFKPKSNRLYTELDDKKVIEEFLGKRNITNAQKKIWNNSPSLKSKYLLEADPRNEVFSEGLSTYDIPLDHLQGSNIYKKNWLGNYKRIEPTSYFSTDWNGNDLNPFTESQKVQYSDFIHPEQAADLAHETRNNYENLFGTSIPESTTRSNDLYPDVSNNWMTDGIERDAMKDYFYQKSMMPESWKGHYDKFIGRHSFDSELNPSKTDFNLNFTDITPEEKAHLFNNIQKQKQGGIIRDDRGQWDHPGEVTEINSNEITMKPDPKTGKPLTKPLLGISDTGDVKLMRPGGNYKFDGKRVTEYPIAQNGKTFLDELKANTAGKKNKVNIRETPPTVVNDNIDNAHKMAVKADEARTKDVRHSNRVAAEKAQSQRDAQRKFNSLPKKEQEKILYDQYNQEHGSISEYAPDSMLKHAGNIAIAPFSALKAKMETGHVPDNLIKGLVQNPEQINPYDAAYLGTLGYAAAPYVSQAASAAAPYMAADATIGGTTLTGVNLNNLINAGFATHGLMNVAPDIKEWADRPSWKNAEKVGWDAVEIAPIAGPASKMIGEGAGYVGNKANDVSSYIGETAPKVKNFIKDAAGDVKGVYNQYKEINEIKNSKSHPNSLFDSAEKINTIKNNYTNQFDSVTQPHEFNSVGDDLLWDFEQKLIRMGGYDFAQVEMKKWKISLVDKNPKLFLELKEVGNGTINPTADDLKRMGKELVEALPKGEEIIPSAKKHLSNIQKQILFDKKKDFETLKEFTKSIGVKTPEVPKVEYTPKEQETIAAIRELGKYRTVAQHQKNKLLADPEAIANINKEILKLDDNVVQDLIGISKSELLDTYKNIVPDTKKTQIDVTSNPIPVSDLSIVDEQNIIQPGIPEEMHPLNEKQFRAIDPKRESLLQRIEQSYAKNFAPINYEKPISHPQGLIGMAKTDYAYPYVLDANNNHVLDANGNVMFGDKLVAEGQVKQQLISALRKVEASPKGTNFIGSGSLSTDSYPLTLDSGIMMSKKGLVEVNVEPGITGLNSMGYTNMSPRLAIKDINSKIEQLEKLSGKKLPRAKYNPSKVGTYEMYEVPRIYFTRLKQGGSINKQDEKVLQHLDQLTNFTNYNNKQSGGWLSKYE